MQLKLIHTILYTQIIFSFLVAGILCIWKEWTFGLSALIGGSIAILPEFFFMMIYFRRKYAFVAKKVVTAFFVGEIVKWLVTIGMFTVSFHWVKLKPLPMLMTFIATQLAFRLVPLIYEQYSIRIYSPSS